MYDWSSLAMATLLTTERSMKKRTKSIVQLAGGQNCPDTSLHIGKIKTQNIQQFFSDKLTKMDFRNEMSAF